ncbi:LOW QUALITY PROTEIN: uncharacterized protein [Aristolochia californica]|uniref:LOW QUALITY PROTEIN: uncharacterized protein n=1 Tax=Aristolochia californica TaxID=171875 RepID=UPI0035DED6A6
MATPDRDDADGLEIISVGTVYRGPLDKKYWSSSRGKDRHPYPIGYHAVRIHAGSTCKMNILEGLKGPLFVISSLDGKSSSGWTPEMAWGKFSERKWSRVKTLHGKRFSCKIDGVELFGFRNPLVQRLLRELVASLHGTAEQSLVSPNSCDDNSRVKHETQIPDSCKYPDLVSYLEEQQNTGRSGKQRNKSRQSSSGTVPKRSRTKFAGQDGEIDSGIKENQFHPYGENNICSTSSDQPLEHNAGMFPIQTQKKCTLILNFDISNPVAKFPTSSLCMSASTEDKNHESENLETKQAPVDLKAIVDSSTIIDDLPLEFCRAVNCSLEEPTVFQKQQKIGRSSNVSLHNDDSLIATNDGGEVPMSARLKHVNDFEDCVADTLDFAQDKIVADSEEPITGLNTGKDIGWSGFSNENSGKSDCDSIGQDLAISMLKALIPSAVPSVKKTYKRKRVRGRITETSKFDPLYLVRAESHKENKSAHHHDCNKSSGVDCLGELEANELDDLVSDSIALITESRHPEDSKLVIPDSLDIAADDHTVTGPLPSGSDKTTHSLPEKRLSCPDILCLPVRLDQTRGPLNYQPMSEEILECYNDKAVVSDCKTEEKNENHLFFPPSGCTVPFEDVLSDIEASNALDYFQGKGHLEQDHVSPGSVKVDIPQSSFGWLEQQPDFSDLKLQYSNIQSEHAKSNHLDPTYSTAKAAAYGKTEDSVVCQQVGPHSYFPSEKHGDPLCKSSPADDCCMMRTFPSTEIECVDSPCNEIHGGIMRVGGVKISVQHQCLNTPRSSPDFKGLMSKMDQGASSHPTTKGCAVDNIGSLCSMKDNTEVVNTKKGCLVEPVGCYTHPAPILSLLLSDEGNDICICVVCGLPTESEQMLFIYKIPIRGKAPKFLGYTSIMLPTSICLMDKKISVESSVFQFTSDARQLILLDRVKAPLCREQNIHCLCLACTSDSCEENALKVVHVKCGYVSIVNKFRTLGRICCMLVCEPNYLLVVEEGGRLHVWVMNLTWRASEEEFDLPSLDCAPSILDLRRLPKCASLVIGHNGTGTFGLWDVSKQVLLTRFSSPGNSICQVIPVGIFCCRKVQSLADLKVEEQIKEIMAETKMSFDGADEDHSFVPSCGENIAVWLLMSTASTEDQNTGSWRLGLLVKNAVLMGDLLDSRASAANASGGQGIIGTFDGLAYMWELSTGAKITNLHYHRGGSISRIATDAKSGAFAIADEECNLRIFVKSSRTNAAVH